MHLNAWIYSLTLAAPFAAVAVHYYRLYVRNRQQLTETQRENNSLNAQLTACRAEGLRASSEYAALVMGCGAGVLLLDNAGNIVEASPAAAKTLGASESQLKGKSLLHATLSPDLDECLEMARTQREIRRCEFRTPGAVNTLSVTIVPVGSTEQPCRCVVIVNDVTERRRLETMRRDFVANVSHELRTPLTSIRAMAETLQDGALNDANVADRFLGIISAEAQRLTRISEDLLVLSHAESRLAELSSVDLSLMVDQIVQRFQKQAANSRIQLLAETEPGLCVSGSADQLEQVLINLIDNAIKYTPEGGRVVVKARPQTGSAWVCVTDTGIGIMNQDLPRIFERFYRVDKARSRESGGTGLGLAIVKHIVESHGGCVNVESEFNRGSTFIVTIPLM